MSILQIKPIKPFEPVRADAIPHGDLWIYQVKWDGVRMLTYYDGAQTRLINRKGNDRTLQYPEFVDTDSFCKASSVILDGEMIAISGDKPSFHEVMKRDSLRREREIRFAVKHIPVVYMIFDVLYYQGEWVTDISLAQRQRLLTDIITPSEKVQLVPNYTDGEKLFAIMKERGWEGIVTKRLDSTYAIGGKDQRWQKLKLGYDLYAVIGGVTFRNGVMNALMLGWYDEADHLVYIGHTGSGKMNRNDWRELTERIEAMVTEKSSFFKPPQRLKGAVWVKPCITVRVQFMDWTPGGTMRHPVLQGIASVSPDRCRATQDV